MINRLFTNKKVTSTLAAVSVVALLLSGTFAWMDYDQHKTNEVYGEGKKYEVTLNEDFTGKTDQDVKVNTPINKDISVSNTGLTNGNYGDLYIRVQLKEFMETYTGGYEYSLERLMVASPEPFDYKRADGSEEADGTENFVQYMNRVHGTNAKFNNTNITDTEGTRVAGKMVSYGNFITFDTEPEATAFAAALKAEFPEYYAVGDGTVDRTPRVIAYAAMDDLDIDTNDEAVTRYYIATQAKDPNGQYGKFLPLKYTVETSSPVVITGTENFSIDAQEQQDNGTKNCWQWQKDNDTDCPTNNPHGGIGYSRECEYPVHKWVSPLNLASNLSTNASSQYFSWQLGPDVIMLKDWDGNPTPKWILDPSANGWAYWGEPLAAGASTTNLLDSFTLYKESDDPFYYAIHTDMEAVSQIDLAQWSDAPPAFLDAFGPKVEQTDKGALNTAISNAGKVDPTQYTSATMGAVTAALEAANAIKADPNATQIQIDSAAQDLSDALSKLTGDKTALGQAIEGAEGADTSAYTPENIAKINEAIVKAKEVFNKVPVTQAEIDAAAAALESVMTSVPKLADKTALKTQIARTPGLMQSDYSTGSWAAMQAKLTPAKSTDTDANATQAAVDLAANNLKTAIDALVKTKALSDEIAADADEYAAPNGTYSTSTQTALKTAYQAATAALGKSNATQAEVDTALANLKTAVAALVNIKPLADEIAAGADEYAAPTTYTPDSYAAFKTAYDTAKTAVAKPNPTQAEIDAAKAAVEAARTALVTRVVTSVTVDPAGPTTVNKGKTQQFAATIISNFNATNVTWSVNSTKSTISATGLLTVAPDENATDLIVTATSVDDPTKSGTATVKVPVVPTDVAVGGTFKADGFDWVVINKDANGNLCIITKQIPTVTSGYADNQAAQDRFYNTKLDKLKAVALPVTIPATEPAWNFSNPDLTSFSSVAATGTPKAFSLSSAEAFVWAKNAGTIAATDLGSTGSVEPGTWQLRNKKSAGNTVGNVFRTGAKQDGVIGTAKIGIRPALWVMPPQ